MIELKELHSYSELPNISLDDVLKNCFTGYLNLCFGLMLADIKERTGKETELYDNMTSDEEYVKNEYYIQKSIISSLENIDYAIRFIEAYGEEDYLRKDFIPFEKFSAYHYDVVCHKVSTIKDLYFKLTNQTYNLGLGNEECKWKKINENKNIIDNPVLFEYFDANEKLNSTIKRRRNASSHDGQQTVPFSSDRRLYFWAVESYEAISNSMPSNSNYERDSYEYSKQIYLAKEESLNEIRYIRNNIFIVTRNILCSLSKKLRENVKQRLPNLDKKVVDSLTKTE